MKKKIGKKKTKSKKNKGKYDVKFIEKVRMLVLQCGMINRRSEIAWSKIAQCLSVTTESIRRWLDPDSKVYKEDFKAAIEEIQQEIDTGNVKHSTLVTATKHTLTRRNWEMADVGPMRPRSSWTIPVLRQYAAEQLGLDLPAKLSKAKIGYAIDVALRKQTVRKRVPSTGSSQEVDPNPEARKLILRNVGKAENRWNLKEEVEGGAITAINITVNEVEKDPNEGKRIEDDQKS